MSAIEHLQRGDRITGPDETHWRVVDPDDHNNTVWVQADAGGDLWIDREELRRKLAAGTFERTTAPEGDQ